MAAAGAYQVTDVANRLTTAPYDGIGAARVRGYTSPSLDHPSRQAGVGNEHGFAPVADGDAWCGSAPDVVAWGSSNARFAASRRIASARR
jgi:hypothetical protein